MDSEGIEFANQTRIACSKALVKWGTGQHDAAMELISELCGKAYGIVQGAKMTTEVEDPERFNLAALKVDLRQHAPEHGDD